MLILNINNIMKLFLSSYEYETFENPREILLFRKEIIDNRNILVVEVDRPIIGQKYGLLDNDIQTLYLVNRINEDAFDKFNLFPIDVHVLIPKSINKLKPSSLSDMQNIAWACLYDNEKDARDHKG